MEICALHIGCFQSCLEDNVLGIELPAPETGTYTIEYYFLEKVITFNIEGIEDEPLSIPVDYFNESGPAKIKIKFDGEYITVSHEGKEYDSFLITVRISEHHVL